MSSRKLELYSEESAERIAKIIGPSSAAAQALACLDRLRRKGEHVRLFRDLRDGTLVVGPFPKELEN